MEKRLMVRMCECMGCMGELDIEQDMRTEIKTKQKKDIL